MAPRQTQQLVGPILVVVGAVALILVGMLVPGGKTSGPGAPAPDAGAAKSPVPSDPLAGRPAPPGADASADNALFDAAVRGDAAAIGAALARGADPNRRYGGDAADLAGYTPIMFAARDGTPEAVTALVAAGADIEARTAAGLTPLMLAAAHNSRGTLEALLAEGADVNARADSGATALLSAVRSGDAPKVKALLEAGAAPDLADAGGGTPLMAAAERSDPALVLLLLDHGATPTAADNSGKTALARVGGRSDEASRQIAQILLEASER